MSSLAAARADNFYYPPGFDPNKHKSLNKFQGQHPLRDRARKLDKGILVIRFEVPFNLFCSKCGDMIGKGVRFNAEKKQVGSYHSTKIWSFSMRHHCGSVVVIETDPKNAEYVVKEGARRKEESYTAEDAEVAELADDEERTKLAADSFFRLEHQLEEKQRVEPAWKQLVALKELQDAKYTTDRNRELRAEFRKRKKQEAAVDARRRELGLADGIQLLPEAEADTTKARLTFFHNDSSFKKNQHNKRRKIMSQSIFDAEAEPSSSAAAASTSGQPAAPAASTSGRPAAPAASTSQQRPTAASHALVPHRSFQPKSAHKSSRPSSAPPAKAASAKRSLADKAAVLAKRMRLEPGVKLKLTSPSGG